MKVKNGRLEDKKKFGDINWGSIDLPIVTTVPKDEKTKRLNFVTFYTLSGLAEVITENSKRFKTQTEVHRAAHYLGMKILAKIFKKKNDSGLYGEDFYNYLERNEVFFRRTDILERTTIETNRLLKEVNKENVKPEKAKQVLKEMINSVPEDIREEVKEKIEKELDINRYSLKVDVLNKILGFKDN